MLNSGCAFTFAYTESLDDSNGKRRGLLISRMQYVISIRSDDDHH
jgi:hypothetical protein